MIPVLERTPAGENLRLIVSRKSGESPSQETLMILSRAGARNAFYAIGGMYVWDALDALLAGPAVRESRGQVSFQAAPVMLADRGLVFAAQVRF